MDALLPLLHSPRARDAFLLRALLDPPWSLLVRDRAPLTLIAAARGEAWLRPGTAAPHRLRAGDVAVVRGPDPYTVSDTPARPPRVAIGPDQHCTTLRGAPLAETMARGVRTWGTGDTGTTVLLVGTYPTPTTVGRRLLAALPPLIVLPGHTATSPLATLLAAEITRDLPGQQAVLDRLLDLALIAALRTWLTDPAAHVSAWYRAAADPVAGRALALLHQHPAHPWTVASLAAAAKVSRATLARRFRALVGQPPMSYLAAWRLELAADLLADPDVTVESVARAVGYTSAFAFSAAFRRHHGTSPRHHRAGHATHTAEEPTP
ncbi:AraC family transcriptional regulator [Thermobifida halotolerans]|uniref:AraC family transcriptional regulator n=1 Tax=Thermobifida halotolerans TaxID=483545 RepID=A0A399G5U9_9ACTN|nr:AraC family transcriptional regulator [Thermobifida halotolerans]UOE21038.1 AraC family transcriptional regulator [Thermobifida halotolerans]